MQMNHTDSRGQSKQAIDEEAASSEICTKLKEERTPVRQWHRHVVSMGIQQSEPLLSLLLLCILCLVSCQAKCRDEPPRDCEAICDSNGRNCSIRALVLLPNDDTYQASLQRVLPILKLAEQHIRSTALIPPHIDFEWLAHDTKCDASFGVIRAMDGIIKQCAQVIFGPVCDYSLGK